MSTDILDDVKIDEKIKIEIKEPGQSRLYF